MIERTYNKTDTITAAIRSQDEGANRGHIPAIGKTTAPPQRPITICKQIGAMFYKAFIYGIIPDVNCKK